MKCKIHPKYQAKRKPRIACDACWWVWFFSSGDPKVPYERLKI